MKFSFIGVILFMVLGVGFVVVVSNLYSILYLLVILVVVLFVLVYCFVIVEEFIYMCKFKLVILVAGIIWILVVLVVGGKEGGWELLDNVV